MMRLCISITMALITLVPGTTGAWMSAANCSTSATAFSSTEPAAPASSSHFKESGRHPSPSGIPAKRILAERDVIMVGVPSSVTQLVGHVQRLVQAIADRLNLTAATRQVAVQGSSPRVPAWTSAELSFLGTSSGAESLGGSLTPPAARAPSHETKMSIQPVDGGIGASEATRTPLIEVSNGAAAPSATSPRFHGFRLVAATLDTLQASVVDAVGRRLSTMPLAAIFGFGHGDSAASENGSAPSGGNGGKTPPPASPTAVLTTPLALTLIAPRVAYAQISAVLAEITLSIYVPPG